MTSSAAVWLVLLLATVGANLPFVNERVLGAGPRLAPKPVGWRLAELVLLWAATLAAGTALERHLGQVAPQRWEFYVATGFLFLTFAFPGFVWRYLRRPR